MLFREQDKSLEHRGNMVRFISSRRLINMYITIKLAVHKDHEQITVDLKECLNACFSNKSTMYTVAVMH